MARYQSGECICCGHRPPSSPTTSSNDDDFVFDPSVFDDHTIPSIFSDGTHIANPPTTSNIIEDETDNDEN